MSPRDELVEIGREQARRTALTALHLAMRTLWSCCDGKVNEFEKVITEARDRVRAELEQP